MKKRLEKIDYIHEVLDYERQCNSNRGRYNCYPPIVPKLLLAIYLRLGVLLALTGCNASIFFATSSPLPSAAV